MRLRAWAVLPLLALTVGCAHLFHARPHEFACGARLAQFSRSYPDDPLIAAIRRDAGRDDDTTQPLTEASLTPEDFASGGLARALLSGAEKAAPQRVLVLSGGGQWGAFGAGFLDALRRAAGAPLPYDAVTGISTGAIQGLFVAADALPDLATKYNIAKQSQIARDKSDFALLTMGARFDTAPLRGLLLAFLCPENSARCDGLERIAAPGRPFLQVGMVRLADGTLRVVDVSDMIRAVYRPGGPAPSPESAQELAECVTGVVMASAAVPAQLRPVRIDRATYADGGVRSSVFAAVVGRAVEGARQRLGKAQPIGIDVIRNGPTVVQRNHDPKHPEDPIPPIDRRPDVKELAGQAYATIVNQVEVSSIAALRFNYPTGTIRVISADGYNAPDRPGRKCPRPPRDHVFDPEFMDCLIDWGAWRAGEQGGEPRWIELKPTTRGAGQIEAEPGS